MRGWSYERSWGEVLQPDGWRPGLVCTRSRVWVLGIAGVALSGRLWAQAHRMLIRMITSI